MKRKWGVAVSGIEKMITNRKKMIVHPDRGAPADRAGADPVAEHVATWTRESEAVDC